MLHCPNPNEAVQCHQEITVTIASYPGSWFPIHQQPGYETTVTSTKCLLENHGCTEGSLLVATVLRLQEQVPLCTESDFHESFAEGTFQQLVSVAV